MPFELWFSKDQIGIKLASIEVQIISVITSQKSFVFFGKESWHKGTLSPVPKPGDLADPNKWKLVCLLETLYKVLASVLAFCINPLVHGHRLENQCGCLNSKG
eukprot:11366612-Ditylum_brightwellii.AAC.1